MVPPLRKDLLYTVHMFEYRFSWSQAALRRYMAVKVIGAGVTSDSPTADGMVVHESPVLVSHV